MLVNSLLQRRYVTDATSQSSLPFKDSLGNSTSFSARAYASMNLEMSKENSIEIARDLYWLNKTFN